MNQRWHVENTRASYGIYEGDTFICEIGLNRGEDEAKELAHHITTLHNQIYPFQLGDHVRANLDITAEMLTLDVGAGMHPTDVIVSKGTEGVVVSVDEENHALPYEVEFKNNGPHDDYWWVVAAWVSHDE